MTVKKPIRSGGYAALITRQKLNNSNSTVDIITITKPSSLPRYNIVVGFNDKDQLQLLTKDDQAKNEEKSKQKVADDLKTTRCENIPIDDIINCVNVENYPNCENTLVFYVTKNYVKEAIALKFENEQDFKRIYFTYKYFKMRNRLTNNNNYSTENFTKKKTIESKNLNDGHRVIDKGRRIEFDLRNKDAVTHISVQQKGRFEQPMSLIGIRSDICDNEIDSIIYTDDAPIKIEKKGLFYKTKKPAINKDNNVMKGEYVRVNVERIPDVVPKENKFNKTPDILMFRDKKPKIRTSPTMNLWSANNKVTSSYESDCEEWKNSRSQFSTTAFDSLARPTKMALALTLKKPPRLEPVPQYYRLGETNPVQFRPNNFLPRPPRIPRPISEIQRNQLNSDHRKFTSLQNLDLPKKFDPKRPNEKKNSNISTRITGITNKLRDLSSNHTVGRLRTQSEVSSLKPVLKNVPDSKRPVVRTCSGEPPKKVTFSAFATVQVV